jgi:hypothetical protein
MEAFPMKISALWFFLAVLGSRGLEARAEGSSAETVLFFQSATVVPGKTLKVILPTPVRLGPGRGEFRLLLDGGQKPVDLEATLLIGKRMTVRLVAGVSRSTDALTLEPARPLGDIGAVDAVRIRCGKKITVLRMVWVGKGDGTTYRCPGSAIVDERVEPPPAPWEALAGPRVRRVERVAFYSGHPREGASLRPNLGTEDGAVWRFSKAEPEGIWMGCLYNETPTMLVQRLPPETIECSTGIIGGAVGTAYCLGEGNAP